MTNKNNKLLREYMNLPYTVLLRRDEEGDVIARIKEFEGCVADGQDEMEALSNLEQVKALWITACLNNNIPIPSPFEDQELPSGKWLQRVPRSLHKKLTETAEIECVSLNQLVTSILAEAVGLRRVLETNNRQRLTEDYPVGDINANSTGRYATTTRAQLKLVPRSARNVPSDTSLPNQVTPDYNQKIFDVQQSTTPSQRIASGYK